VVALETVPILLLLPAIIGTAIGPVEISLNALMSWAIMWDRQDHFVQIIAVLPGIISIFRVLLAVIPQPLIQFIITPLRGLANKQNRHVITTVASENCFLQHIIIDSTNVY
jgi:hypothetical protein